MKETCASISELLEKYFDGEVTGEEESLVTSHLQECPSCQNVLRSMEDLRHVIKAPVDQAEEKENFYWVWQKIERGIRQKEPSGWKDFLDRRFFHLPRLRRWIWAPAAVMVVVLLMVVFPHFYYDKETPSSPDRSVVEYVESQGNPVMVFDLEKEDVTVIWLFENPEGEGLSQS